jgi:NTE family protein
MSQKTALVLSGGGARAAYQAGFLRGLAEAVPDTQPFEILSGTSAGAINCAHLASHLHEGFHEATNKLWNLWAGLVPSDVFQTGTFSLSGLAVKWLTKLTFGGSFGTGKINYLLDTSPLRKLLQENCDFNRIETELMEGRLAGLSFSATNYQTGTAVTFFSTEPGADTDEWFRTDRIGIRTRHRLEHVMASSAIPVFFPPEELDGFFFGDGCVRQTTPLSPPIHMGADRILTIGVRAMRPVEKTIAMNQPRQPSNLQLAEIGGTVLNAVFLDSVEKDAERFERINRTLSLIPEERRREHPNQLRVIPFKMVRPSLDLGGLARDISLHFPGVLRHMLKGLGAGPQNTSTDLISYLAFDGRYTRRLLDLGKQDALALRDELKAFLT